VADRDSFLRAIRASPDDEGMRLVYADWLEERGDPLGEFIRLQCALEPIREDYDNPRADELRKREARLLDGHRAAWLGPVAGLLIGWGDTIVFRRGLVEEAALPLQTFLDRADDLAAWCPLLRALAVFEVRGRGGELARSPHLGRISHLEVADWITAADARTLASSPYLGNLQTLRVWLGGEQDPAVCRAFADPAVMLALRRIDLLQLYGGLMAGERAAALHALADELAAEVNRTRGVAVARVCRPFADSFPLNRKVGHDIYAGRLPGHRQALAFAAGTWCLLVEFDGHGNYAEHHRLTPEPAQPGEPEPNRSPEEELLEYLRDEFGFELAFIHVKEFSLPDERLDVYRFHGAAETVIANPDVLSRRVTAEQRTGAPERIYHWLKGDNFVIDWGNDYWADREGTIHSS
jgi:uncharacterized protein (TIGR02996 family)